MRFLCLLSLDARALKAHISPLFWFSLMSLSRFSLAFYVSIFFLPSLSLYLCFCLLPSVLSHSLPSLRVSTLVVFTKPEMAEIVKTFITASDYRADRKRLNNELVRLLQRLVEGSLFDDASARNSLMGVIGVRFKTQAAEQ